VIDADWQLKRQRGVAFTTRVYREVYGEADARMKRLLDFAGLDPAHAVLRWGNYNQTLLLPGTAFQADDTGRSYRLRPNTQTIWLKGVALPRNLSGFFLVPDRPELPQLVEGTGAFIVPGSSQRTNSWGLRGPEPDLEAPVRGIILGDSNMQGLFVGDDETPPECLRRELEGRLKTRVSVLNTGHLGYSPEQFYYCLREYYDRFRPNFVLITFCLNDFGDGGLALAGVGDWEEGKYWLDEIAQFCRVRNILYVVAPVPSEIQTMGPRGEGRFPGRISDLCQWSSVRYCNPMESIIDEQLRLRLETEQHGKVWSSSPLYNGHLSDYHFSAKGCRVWARAVGERLALLFAISQLRTGRDASSAAQDASTRPASSVSGPDSAGH
jgi:hypothetical protein